MEKEKRNKKKIGCMILVSIGVCCIVAVGFKIYRDLSNLQENFKPIVHSNVIEYKEIGQTIFITTRTWGLSGQHSHTIISDKNHAYQKMPLDRDKEIVLDEICSFYYKKQEPDSLLIFFSSGSYSEEEIIRREVDKVKVKITKYKIPMNKYYKNYKDIGLTLISCYE